MHHTITTDCTTLPLNSHEDDNLGTVYAVASALANTANVEFEEFKFPP